ncbi:MAG: sigma-70 family RNA polymerase sigma factor [Vescimonas sp.]
MVEKIALREAIDSLPERERITILLRFFRGMTQEQTARILKVSQVQVSRLERKGLAKLREILEA